MKDRSQNRITKAIMSQFYLLTPDSESKGRIKSRTNSTTYESAMPALCPNSRRPKRTRPTSDRAKLLRIREAAEYLNTSVWKLRQLVSMGKISFVQFGPSTSPMFFTRESLDKLIRDREELI